MDVNNETISTVTDTVVTLSGLGDNGVALFAVVVVAAMFFFMGWIAIKSLKNIMANHKDNAKRIDEAHSRIYTLEQREDKCLQRVDKVTGELEACATDFKALLEKYEMSAS